MLIGGVGSNPLLFLFILACPVGMGLMMLFMGRGMMGGMKQHKNADEGEAGGSELAQMKSEQARLAEKIEALEGQQSQPKTAEPAPGREPDPVS